MKSASITETKNHLSALLEKVRHGETILITDRGIPVARLESVNTAGFDDPDGRLARLERQGLLIRAKAPPPVKLISRRPPKPRKGGDILKALLEERRTGW